MAQNFTILFFALTLATSAFAQCARPEDTIFTCEFDEAAKTVEICLIDTGAMPKVSYTYSPKGGDSELTMEAEFAPASTHGGYYISYDEGQTGLLIKTGDLTYTVQFEKEGDNIEHGFLDVREDGNDISVFYKTCDLESEDGNPSALWQKLDESGWYYIYDSEYSGWVEKKHIK